MVHREVPIQGQILIRNCTKDDLAKLVWYARSEAKGTYLDWAFAKAQRGESVFLAAAFADMAFGRCQLHWRSEGNPQLADGATCAELDDLFVHSPFRRLGVGTALIRTCLDLARTGGLRCVRAGVEAKNTTALRLYQAEGFVSAGDTVLRWGDWSIPARVMQRML